MPLQKLCCRCGTSKPATDFYANKRMKDGLNTFCIVCHKADNVARKAIKRADTAFRNAEEAAKKVYRARTVTQRQAYMQEWRTKNAAHVVQYSKAYRENNKAFVHHLCELRKKSLLQRTPAWLTVDDFWCMEEAYSLAHERTKLTGVQWHVDHAIPLRGKLVSGLHVPNNLRVIPATENMRKTNKFEV